MRKDKEAGLYADPDKVHKIHHEGEHYRVEGPFLSAPSLFLTAPSPEVEHGRRPEDVTFHQGLTFVVGATEAEAREKFDAHRRYLRPEGYALHSTITDLEGRVYPADTPLGEVQTNGSRGRLDDLVRALGPQATVADWVNLRMDGTVVGTPARIADELEAWQAAGVDGINVINWVIPGSFEEFAELVMPVLRKRGLAQG